MTPIPIPESMPDWMALAYQAINEHVIEYRRDLARIETHFQAIIAINQAISQVTHKKGLKIKHSLTDKDFKYVNKSMEDDLKLMSQEIEKRLSENPNRIITNTRFTELIAKRRQNQINTTRTDTQIKQIRTQNREGKQHRTPLEKVNDQRRREKLYYNKRPESSKPRQNHNKIATQSTSTTPTSTHCTVTTETPHISETPCTLPHATPVHVPPYKSTIKITSHIPVQDYIHITKPKKRHIKGPEGKKLTLKKIGEALTHHTSKAETHHTSKAETRPSPPKQIDTTQQAEQNQETSRTLQDFIKEMAKQDPKLGGKVTITLTKQQNIDKFLKKKDHPVEVMNDEEKENRPVQVMSDEDEENHAVEVMSNEEEENHPVEVMIDEEKENRPVQVMSNEDKENHPVEVMSDEEKENRPVQVMSDEDKENHPVEVMSNEDEENHAVEVMSDEEKENRPVEVMSDEKEENHPVEVMRREDRKEERKQKDSKEERRQKDHKEKHRQEDHKEKRRQKDHKEKHRQEDRKEKHRREDNEEERKQIDHGEEQNVPLDLTVEKEVPNTDTPILKRKSTAIMEVNKRQRSSNASPADDESDDTSATSAQNYTGGSTTNRKLMGERMKGTKKKYVTLDTFHKKLMMKLDDNVKTSFYRHIHTLKKDEHVWKSMLIKDKSDTVTDFLCDKCEFKTRKMCDIKRHILSIHLHCGQKMCTYRGCQFTAATAKRVISHYISDHSAELLPN